jgi:hypothetical protein
MYMSSFLIEVMKPRPDGLGREIRDKRFFRFRALQRQKHAVFQVFQFRLAADFFTDIGEILVLAGSVDDQEAGFCHPIW